MIAEVICLVLLGSLITLTIIDPDVKVGEAPE